MCVCACVCVYVCVSAYFCSQAASACFLLRLMPQLRRQDASAELEALEASSAEAPRSNKDQRQFNDAEAIKDALNPHFTDCRVVFGESIPGHSRQEQAVDLGPKLRALRQLQPSLSFQRQAFEDALAKIAKRPDWKLNKSEKASWVDKAKPRLLDACRFVSQAEKKLLDGRRAPPWLEEVLQLQATTSSSEPG